MDRSQALDALAAAGSAGNKVRRRSRWYAFYAVVYAIMSFAVTAAIGLFPGLITMLVSTTAWVVTITLLSVYAARQPVAPHRFKTLHLGAIGGWTVVYTVTVVVGSTSWPGEPAWWLPGAALSAVPPLIAAGAAMSLSRESDLQESGL